MSLTYSGLSLNAPLPSQIVGPNAEGLRRGYIGDSPSIWMDWKTTIPYTIPANTYGVVATVATTPNKPHIVRAKIKPDYGGTGLLSNSVGRKFAIVVNGIVGTSITLTNDNQIATLPPYSFTPTSASASVAVVITEAVLASGPLVPAVRVGIFDMSVRELDYVPPQKLRNTVFSSSLDNHFDLACNSVGGSWYVDKAGVTRFNNPVNMLPVSHVFSDDRGPEFLEYVDIEADYDTASVINTVEVTNLGIGGDGNESNGALTYVNQESIAQYGICKESLTTNVRVGWGEGDEPLTELIRTLTTVRAQPRVSISKIVWNAQQNLQAAQRIDLGQRVVVRYRGQEYDAQIIGLENDITPTRWLMTISLRLN